MTQQAARYLKVPTPANMSAVLATQNPVGECLRPKRAQWGVTHGWRLLRSVSVALSKKNSLHRRLAGRKPISLHSSENSQECLHRHEQIRRESGQNPLCQGRSRCSSLLQHCHKPISAKKSFLQTSRAKRGITKSMVALTAWTTMVLLLGMSIPYLF